MLHHESEAELVAQQTREGTHGCRDGFHVETRPSTPRHIGGSRCILGTGLHSHRSLWIMNPGGKKVLHW